MFLYPSIQLKTMSSHQCFQFQSNIPGFILVFSLSVIITPFSDNDKPHPHYPYIWTYLTHLSVYDQPLTTPTLFLCSCHPHSSSTSVLPAKPPSYAEIFLTFLKLWYPALNCPPIETFLSLLEYQNLCQAAPSCLAWIPSWPCSGWCTLYWAVLQYGALLVLLCCAISLSLPFSGFASPILGVLWFSYLDPDN